MVRFDLVNLHFSIYCTDFVNDTGGGVQKKS